MKRNSLTEQPPSLMSDSGPDGLRARMSQRYRPQLARIPRVTASGCFYRADSLDRCAWIGCGPDAPEAP